MADEIQEGSEAGHMASSQQPEVKQGSNTTPSKEENAGDPAFMSEFVRRFTRGIQYQTIYRLPRGGRRS